MKSFVRNAFALICIIPPAFCFLSPCMGLLKTTKPCLDFVRQKLEDPNAYWFGNAYSTTKKCGYQDAAPIDAGVYVSSREMKCMNQRPADKSGTYLTTGSRIWVDNNYKSDRYLKDLVGVVDVQYHSPPGDYHGCNTSATWILDTTFDVYPGGTPVQAFLARNPPKLTFPLCTLNSLCTIIFFDAGNGVLHNAWTNWPKNQDFSNYIRPAPPGFEPNPYVFLVYSQSGEIQAEEASGSGYGAVQKFVTEYNLKGPLGLNVIEIVSDISAQEAVTNYGIGNNCVSIIETIINNEGLKINLELGVTYPVDFSAWLTLKYDHNGKSFWVDSIQNPFLKREDIQTKPEAHIQLDILYQTVGDFTNKLYTLLAVNPAGLFIDKVGIVPKVFVTWFVTNIVEGSVAKGNEIQQYTNTDKSYFSYQMYFLLLLQDKRLEQNGVEKYFDPACVNNTNDRDRCQFNLGEFIKENRLTLSSLARFKIGNMLQFPLVHNIVG